MYGGRSGAMDQRDLCLGRREGWPSFRLVSTSASHWQAEGAFPQVARVIAAGGCNLACLTICAIGNDVNVVVAGSCY